MAYLSTSQWKVSNVRGYSVYWCSPAATENSSGSDRIHSSSLSSFFPKLFFFACRKTLREELSFSYVRDSETVWDKHISLHTRFPECVQNRCNACLLWVLIAMTGHDDNTINIVVVIVIINRLLLSCKLLRYISEVCSVSTQVLVHSCLAWWLANVNPMMDRVGLSWLQSPFSHAASSVV